MHRRVLTLSAVCTLLAAGPLQAAFHCFYEDSNLGYILEPEQGLVTVWGGIVPQPLNVIETSAGEGVIMQALTRTVIGAAQAETDFLPMIVTERFTLSGYNTVLLEVEAHWQKQDGTDFPAWFAPTDFASEPFVPGVWQMVCEMSVAEASQ